MAAHAFFVFIITFKSFELLSNGNVISTGDGKFVNSDILRQLKAELRNDIMTEIKEEIGREVRTQIRSAIKDEVYKSYIRKEAEECKHDKDVDDDDLDVESVVREIVQRELKNGIHDRILNEIKTDLMREISEYANINRPGGTDYLKRVHPKNPEKNHGNADLIDSGNNFDGTVYRHSRSLNQVAFSVYLDHVEMDLRISQTIKFNQVILNEGNFYNSHTGVFTAPIAGVYLFHFEFIGYFKFTELRLVVDNDIVATAIVQHPSSNSSYAIKANTMTLIRVSLGQSVWVETFAKDHANVISSSSDRSTSFIGVLLY